MTGQDNVWSRAFEFPTPHERGNFIVVFNDGKIIELKESFGRFNEADVNHIRERITEGYQAVVLNNLHEHADEVDNINPVATREAELENLYFELSDLLATGNLNVYDMPLENFKGPDYSVFVEDGMIYVIGVNPPRRLMIKGLNEYFEFAVES